MSDLTDGTPTAKQAWIAQRDYEHRLESLRRWYPEYRIVEVTGGGFLVFPAAVPHTESPTLDDLLPALVDGRLSVRCPCPCHRSREGRCDQCCDGMVSEAGRLSG